MPSGDICYNFGDESYIDNVQDLVPNQKASISSDHQISTKGGNKRQHTRPQTKKQKRRPKNQSTPKHIR